MTRSAIIFRKADPIPDPVWRTKPSRRSVAAVTARLGAEAAGALARARIEWRPAAEVLREANRSPLPLDDPDVARHIRKVRDGKPLAPVVVDGTRLVDGEHRLTVAHAHSPQTKVPVLDVRAESDGPQMAKNKKAVRKAEQAIDALGESLVELQTVARRENLNAGQRATIAKASREAQRQYLASVRPWAAPTDADIRTAAEDDDSLFRKAEQIRKADPNVSKFEAMRRAGRRAA